MRCVLTKFNFWLRSYLHLKLEAPESPSQNHSWQVLQAYYYFEQYTISFLTASDLSCPWWVPASHVTFLFNLLIAIVHTLFLYLQLEYSSYH